MFNKRQREEWRNKEKKDLKVKKETEREGEEARWPQAESSPCWPPRCKDMLSSFVKETHTHTHTASRFNTHLYRCLLTPSHIQWAVLAHRGTHSLFHWNFIEIFIQTVGSTSCQSTPDLMETKPEKKKTFFFNIPSDGCSPWLSRHYNRKA